VALISWTFGTFVGSKLPSKFGTAMANLHRFDLNLLVALDMLLTERSVTRAADRLCVTQPSLSGSLQRLREHFNDPLMLRFGREMELTSKARALIGPVRSALLQIDNALEARAQFEPATSEQTFRVAMSDYCVHLFLPLVIRRIAAEAPGVRIVVENISASSVGRLEGGEIDLIITVDLRLFGRDGRDAELRSQGLFEDEVVCVVAADHPVGDQMTLDDYCRYPHALRHFGSNVRNVEDADIERQGITIKDKVTIPTFTGLLALLPGTNLIATVPKRLANSMAKTLDVRILEVPIKLPTIQEATFWHRRNDDDLGQRWLRDLLKEVGATLE
jgi:LysR family nod box-dependent transcriptional activator